MKKFIGLLFAVVAFATPVSSFGQYQLDDGNAEFYVGVGDGIINWGNAFEPIGGAEFLQTIEFGFGIGQSGSLVGENVIWTVFADSDLDPTNGGTVVLAQGNHVIENDNFAVNGILDTIDISSENIIVDSNFFVSANFVDTVGQALPASLDANTLLGQSFFSTSADPTDYLGGQSNDSIGLNGSWIIRAQGTAIPEPSLAGLAGVAVLGLARRRRRA